MRAMSISPPSDLILDVMKAADPQRMQEAALRLKDMAAARAAAAETGAGKWSESLRMAGFSPAGAGRKISTPHLDAASGTRSPAPSATDAAAGRALTRAPATADGSGDAVRRMREGFAALEGVVLENMLDGMLGGSGSKVFGEGLAGEYWKSMMARAIASQVARRSGMGLAEALVRRAGGPDGPAGAASALGMSQRLEKTFLDTLEREAVAGEDRKEVS